MTIAPQSPTEVAPTDLVTVSVDGIEVRVPKGMLVIRVAELMGIEIPRFCDHPLLDPVAIAFHGPSQLAVTARPMAMPRETARP